MSARSRLWLVLFAAACLCAPLVFPARADVPPPPDPVVPEVMAPPPFTAEVLQTSITAGETWQFRIIETNGPTFTQTMRVTSADATGIQIETTEVDDFGNPIAMLQTHSFGWSELVTHASYPADTTVIDQGTFTVGEVPHATVHYHVTEADGTVIDATFATDIPGPPVHMTVVQGAEPVMEMTMLSHTEGQ